MSKGQAPYSIRGRATICCPPQAEGVWLQQKGRSPRSELLRSNWSSRMLGTHPLKSLPPRDSCLRLERLPSSAGISPAQLVLVEFQPSQVGEAAQPRRYLSAQVVVVEIQPFQVGGNGRSSARAKIPRKSRGVLISIHSLCLLGRGVTARRIRILTPGGKFPAPPWAAIPRAVVQLGRPQSKQGP